MFFVRNSIILLLCLSCRRHLTFNPDFHVGDSTTASIISERGESIACNDPRFNDYAAMHIEKIKELRKLLMKVDVGRSNKKKINAHYTRLLKMREELL